jgi:amicoumacin kinase
VTAPPPSLLPPWDLDEAAPPVLVSDSGNQVFRARRGGETVYLRVTPASYRSGREVEGELRWMGALAAAGLRVVPPVPSTAGRLVEETQADGQPAWVSCVRAGPGRPAHKPGDYRPPLIASWASLLADLHAQARARAPSDSGRRAWDEDRVFETALQASAPETQPAQEQLRLLVAWMRRLPRSPDSFGLTHADLHLGNLTVHGAGAAEDQVTAFDFDDACHHWFVHDVAVAVTSIRKAAWEHPGAVDAPGAEATFLDTYARREVLPPRWIDRLEAFVAYRLALSACWAGRSHALGQLDADMTAWYHRSLPWWLDQLTRRQASIARALSA